MLAHHHCRVSAQERKGHVDRKLRYCPGDLKGHVNNVVYNRYAESGRIAWVRNYAKLQDPAHRSAWNNLWTPKGEVGLILRKITTEFKL
jgi:acyl-CoA thioesterase FadM